MSLVEESKELIAEFLNKSSQEYIHRNTALYEVNEGNILPHILQALKPQFGENTYEQMTFRIPPINILKRVVDKLSRIYQPGPSRYVTGGQDKDDELLAWYQDHFSTDVKMNTANEYFNLFKNTLIKICLVDGVPTLTPLPSDRSYVFAKNRLNPMKVTHVLTVQETYVDLKDTMKKSFLYHLYSDQEFLILQDDIVRWDLLEEAGNPEGINPYGKLPFVYVTKSNNEIIPIPDTDMYNMSLLVPICLTDLNAGMMFSVHPIKYVINLSAEKLVYSPNSVWTFKVDPGQDGKSEIGILKPDMNSSEALTLIQAQLGLWFQTIGIRPGAIGNLTTETQASGISKMIDEMDTAEHRMKQIGYFQKAEDDLWDFVLNYAHPYWISSAQIDQSLAWSPAAKVTVNFAEQIPMQTKAELLKSLIDSLNAGLTTKRRALREANPRMTEKEIDELLFEIEQEKSLKLSIGDLQNAQSLKANDENVGG